MALAVSLVAPRVLAVTIPSWLVEAMSKSPIFQTTVQSKGPPVARNWKVAPIIKEIFLIYFRISMALILMHSESVLLRISCYSFCLLLDNNLLPDLPKV